MASTIAAAAFAVALDSAPARAEAAISVSGAAFDRFVEVGGERLELRGTGLLRYRVVFRAYAAALYLEPGLDPNDAFASSAKRLEIEYFWPIDAQAFSEAAEVLLERNLDPREMRALRERIDALHQAYESVEAGERYALTYLPGRGTELAKRGTDSSEAFRSLAVVPGDDFAAAYFSIWLGDQPIDEGLRQSLLTPTPTRARD